MNLSTPSKTCIKNLLFELKLLTIKYEILTRLVILSNKFPHSYTCSVLDPHGLVNPEEKEMLFW